MQPYLISSNNTRLYLADYLFYKNEALMDVCMRFYLLLLMDKSIAAVNTAVHRSKLTIAAVNQNSTGWRYGGGDGGG